MKPAFSFQVTSSGVVINLNPDVTFGKLKDALLKHVNDASNFFAGVDIYININGRTLEIQQLEELMTIVEKYENVNKIYFAQEQRVAKPKVTLNKDTILIKRTVRSGQRIKYPTNIVILGDVNPGAEIIAGGDVIVLGKLRGVVHAGAGGTIEAQVIALRLEPTQLRIASIISRPPDGEKITGEIKPERAYVKNSSIIVEKLFI